MEQEAIVDEVAALGFDADDGRVGRLVLPIIEGPRVVDLEVEVHRAGFLRLEPELEGHSLVRLDLLDRPEPLDLDGPAHDWRDAFGGPVPLVRMFISNRFQRFALSPAFVVSRKSRG